MTTKISTILRPRANEPKTGEDQAMEEVQGKEGKENLEDK